MSTTQEDLVIKAKAVILAAVTLTLVTTGEAHSISIDNYKVIRADATKRVDHAQDVFRFFKNHPKPAQSKIGRHVLRAQGKALRWNEHRLRIVQDYVYSGQFLPWKWRQIVQCETHTNWQHNSGSYQGAFGFANESWDRFNTFGYPSEAYLATPEQQYQVALAIYYRYGYTGWGCA